jgi:hypothetical protein
MHNVLKMNYLKVIVAQGCTQMLQSMCDFISMTRQPFTLLFCCLNE